MCLICSSFISVTSMHCLLNDDDLDRNKHNKNNYYIRSDMIKNLAIEVYSHWKNKVTRSSSTWWLPELSCYSYHQPIIELDSSLIMFWPFLLKRRSTSLNVLWSIFYQRWTKIPHTVITQTSLFFSEVNKIIIFLFDDQNSWWLKLSFL